MMINNVELFVICLAAKLNVYKLKNLEEKSMTTNFFTIDLMNTDIKKYWPIRY